MAGGAKETPRQRMIGMMYLVLTALLALQVSNAVLDKFIFIDESLRHSVQLTMETNGHILEGIKAAVEKNGAKDRDKGVLKKAETARQLTSDMITYLKDMRETIVKESGGRDPETGEYLGAKDYDKQMNYTLGAEGQKNGAAYVLKEKMNEYVDKINALHDSLKLPPLALDAKDIVDEQGRPLYANNPDQIKKDFAYLYFDHTPTVACLAVLSQLKSEVARVESKALEALAAEVGADQIRFDKVIAVVKPKSQVVAAGTKYEAEMFIAASSTSARPTMTYNGQSIKVEDGKGMVEFVAQGGEFSNEGTLEKEWKGSITISTPLGDTTFTVNEKYTVAKPVINIEAAAVKALYFNCGNELNIQVPALGNTYEPTFQCEGGEVIKGAKKGLVTIVPDKPQVAITVFSTGNKIGVEKFRVKPVPKPELKAFIGNKPADLKNGLPASSVRSITLKALPDPDFKEFLPKDARYKVVSWEATLARGKRGIKNIKATDETINVTEFAAAAREGDRIIIEIKRVMRMNFKGNTEEVKGVSSEILTIPLN